MRVSLCLSPITPNKTNEQKSSNNKNNSKAKQKNRRSYSLTARLPCSWACIRSKCLSDILFHHLPHAAQIAEHTCWVLSFHPAWASDSSHSREEDMRMCPALLCDTLKPGREWTAHCEACALLRCPLMCEDQTHSKASNACSTNWVWGRGEWAVSNWACFEFSTVHPVS